MNLLRLPEQFEGAWEHALIMTYGADIPFFEHALLRQFGAQCRNKIILADADCFLESCGHYAEAGLIRQLNQQYVVEGILSRHAAHAKLILLTNAKRGRLLVGSGNLSWQGYASGGELFSRYEYNADKDNQPNTLNAFSGVREFLETLLKQGYIQGLTAQKRIAYLFEKTPWLYRAPAGTEQPVRHNLEHSFLTQLEQVIGNEPVKTLHIHAPFYDQGAVALKTLLNTFNPAQAIMLLQPNYTSLDPSAVRKVLSQFPHCRPCVFKFKEASSATPYVHAKFYLLKTETRAICLQGSPNLSQVAMLRTASLGNIELANLLIGPPDAFDGLLEPFALEPAPAQLESIGLSYVVPGPKLQELSTDFQLIGGEWAEDHLTLNYRGTLPDLNNARIVIGTQPFRLKAVRQEINRIIIYLPPEAANLLTGPIPVRLRWGKSDEATGSNPIFVCNQKALNDILEVDDAGQTLDRFGGLELEDEEFERLLGELDAALMIDRRSVWQLAGKSIPQKQSDSDDEALHLAYSDIDYDLLRNHPRIAQYMLGRGGGQAYARSRLQVILSSITNHFRGLLAVTETVTMLEKTMKIADDSDAETEEEREAEEQEKQRRHISQAKRQERILKNFVQRYLEGLHSPDFQKLAGFEVIVQNTIIFSHILWRLFAKGWVEEPFIIESLLEIWQFFWGDHQSPSYFNLLDKEQKAQTLKLMADHYTIPELLAALYYSAYLSRTWGWEDGLLALRDFWCTILTEQPFEITAQTLEETWCIVSPLFPYEIPVPTRIVNELKQLAYFETEFNFLRMLESEYRCSPFSCKFDKTKVNRPAIRQEIFANRLLLPQNILFEQQQAITILKEWMRFETVDYYRLAVLTPEGKEVRLLFYETAEQSGIFWAKDTGDEPVDFDKIKLDSLDWEITLRHLQTLAAKLEKSLILQHPAIIMSQQPS